MSVRELSCFAFPYCYHACLQLRKAFQMMLAEYKVVTDRDKAEVVSLGGLHVIGTERHESRRIDNQVYNLINQ